LPAPRVAQRAWRSLSQLLRNILGFKYRIITGFRDSSEMNLAMQRGEVDGRATFTWTSLKPRLKEWVESGQMIVLYQQALQKHPDIPDVPLVLEFASTDEQKKMLELEFSSFQLGRPYFVPEGVPTDRVAALRRAFDQSMKDKELLADADQRQIEVDPTRGEDMQGILARVYATPKELVQRVREASGSQPN
jgi:tripartite-type tricarboxylate transporter receptor subunit TctC